MSEIRITPYTVTEGKVTALKVEDNLGKEVIETEPFDADYMSSIAPSAVALAHRKRQLAVFKQSYEEALTLFTEAEANLKQAILQASHTNTISEASKHASVIPQKHEEGCGCSECAEKHRQEFEQQIVQVKEETKSTEPIIEVEPAQQEEKEETIQTEVIELRQPLILEFPTEKTAEQWSEEIYEKLMQDLHTNFKGKTLKREEIIQKLTGEYGVPDTLAQEVISIIHERARKEKKISEPKGEGLFGSIAKRLRKSTKKE